MGLEDFTPGIESWAWEWKAIESAKEVSENFKESFKKAGQKKQKAIKDEKKAKKYDLLLASFLVKILLDKKYDFLLDSLFKCLDEWYPSNFILWILSLINIDISNKIREIWNKEKIIFDYINNENIEFDDSNLDLEIKNRINYWVEDIENSITFEYSNLQLKKLTNQIKENDNNLVEYFMLIFSFFLKEININISESKAKSICEFIIWEIKKSIKKYEIEEI